MGLEKMPQGQGPGYDGFMWFIAIVENVNDPKKLGKVQIRFVTEHSNRVETDEAIQHWATPIVPITSASVQGVGISPTGITKGAKVFGFFADTPNKKQPYILGTIPVIDGGDAVQHSVSKQARGEWKDDKKYIDGEGTFKDIKEPRSKYKAEYPNNKTITTKRGHVIELDDTPEAERIHIYHRNGAYVEMDPDGNIVARASSNSGEFVQGKKIIFTKDGNITIAAEKGDISLVCKGDVNIQSTNGVINMKAPVVGLNA